MKNKTLKKISISCPNCGEETFIVVHESKFDSDSPIVNEFVHDVCHNYPEAVTPARDLYRAFKTWWSERFTESPISMKKFGMILGKNFKKEKSGTFRYLGIGLK